MSNLREAPIGVFDSGIGGLTVVREIMRQIPQERIVYFGIQRGFPTEAKAAIPLSGIPARTPAF